MRDDDAKTVFENGQAAMARLIHAETIASGKKRPRGDELTTLVMLFTAGAFSTLAITMRDAYKMPRNALEDVVKHTAEISRELALEEYHHQGKGKGNGNHHKP